MAAQPAGADNSAQGMAMLGLMQQLTFNGASIRFDDDSLTGKVLDYVAKQQGMKPEDIANQAKAIVPFLTGAAQQSGADASRSPTAVDALSRRPEEPRDRGRARRAGAVRADHGRRHVQRRSDLTKTLGVTVTANQY